LSDGLREGDRELARRMSAGDERAFAEFFDAYFGGIYRFALARLDRDQDAAQEVAQATLARAAFKIAGYRGEAALFTWLCTVCRREAGAYLRRNRRAGRPVELREEALEIRAALESLASEPPAGSAAALRRADVVRAVQVTLDALPRRYGDALEWKYVLGLSVEEIADRLGLGPKAAESLLSRARQAFRDGFAAQGVEP
jgi:RNA polymerase sigma-70 factor (ECF subfamily)